MIQLLAERTARYLADGDDPADIEVIAYGYYMFYQQWLTILAILITALVVGIFPLVLISVAVFMILRGCVGGTHATHPVICKMSAFVFTLTPPIVSEFSSVGISLPVMAVLYLLSVALVARYTPGETDVKKFRDPRVRKRMKIESLAWISGFFLVAAILSVRLPSVAFVIAVTAFVTTSLVHPIAYWLFGFDPETKEARRPRWQ